MDALKLVQQTIVYLEDHLLEELTLESIAHYLEISPYHLNQTFTMICNMNIREYITGRRMTESALELIHDDNRLVDIADKYLFSDVHVFTEAFNTWHGISPIQARSRQDHLKLLHRLYVKYAVTDTPPIHYSINEYPSVRLAGYRIQFSSDSLDEHFLIPDALFDAQDKGDLDRLAELNSAAPLYVVTHPIEDGLELFIGVPYEKDTTLETEYIHHTRFASFNQQGQLDYLFNSIWHSIESQVAITLQFLHNDFYIAKLSLPLDFDSAYTKMNFLLPIQ